ncbi:hypothetical protein EJD97_006977 [Solanum chilense]|uniref:Retrotransposon gag domain-containing protein n=1 Tax=Solanum chilense TaxID=4083 RepID=A0A6N2CDA7_SOLCI|nr:hypothetical protein EJD97_006977 [Solanum chilense]
MALGNAEQRERVTQLGALIGGTNDGEDLVDLVTPIQRVKEEFTFTKEFLNEKVFLIEAEYAFKHETIQQKIELVRTEKEDPCGEVLLLHRVLQGGIGPIRMMVLEPKSYNGVRSAKELENFLWDIENYFKAAKVQDAEKVSVATMYLCDDAKVWWNTRVVKVEGLNLPQIETWEMLKKELKT